MYQNVGRRWPGKGGGVLADKADRQSRRRCGSERQSNTTTNKNLLYLRDSNHKHAASVASAASGLDVGNPPKNDSSTVQHGAKNSMFPTRHIAGPARLVGGNPSRCLFPATVRFLPSKSFFRILQSDGDKGRAGAKCLHKIYTGMCCVWIRNLDEQMRNTLDPLTSLGMNDMTCDRAGRAGWLAGRAGWLLLDWSLQASAAPLSWAHKRGSWGTDCPEQFPMQGYSVEST